MILQEYLVKLGWNIDEPSMKKFVGAISATGARTAELSAVVLETAGAVEAMVSRVARQYETLYYASQRTNQSVKYIQATQYAFKGIGLSAEEANASIEHIAANIRTQPWLKGIFGNASTPQDIASRLGKSGLPYFLQTRFAEMIGMDEKTLLHLQKFAQVEAAARATLAQRQKEGGLDPQKLSEQSANLGRELTKLEGTLGVFGDRIAQDLIEPTTKAVKRLDEMAQWLNRVNNATNGWVGTLGTLAGTAGGLLVLEKVLRRVLGIGGATATGKLLGVGKRGLGVGLKGGTVFGAAAVLSMIKTNDPAEKASLRKLLGPIAYELGLSKSPDLTDDGSKPATKGPAAGQQSDRAKQIVETLVAAGYPLSSAQGVAAGLYSENTGFDPKKKNKTSGMIGIGQWDTARRAKFKEKFLKNMEEGSFEEQLQFVIHELETSESATGNKLKKGGQSARDAAGTFIHGFERPGAEGEASDMSRAGPFADALSKLAAQQSGAAAAGQSITLNSKTEVHVNAGGPDVASTAKAYGDAHDKANDNLLRNVTGVLR